MRSSSRAASVGAWAAIAFYLLFGLFLVTEPLWGEPGRSAMAHAGFICFGLAVMSVAVVVRARRSISPSRPEARTHEVVVDGRPALEVRLRDHQLWGVLAIGVAWSAFFGWAIVAVGVDGPGWLLLPFFLLFLVLVPDPARALTRRSRVLLTETGVDFHGWGIDAALAWDDVVLVDFAAPHRRRPVVRIEGRPDAPSWRVERHRILISLDKRPDTPRIDIPLDALDARGAFLTYVNALRRDAPDVRSRWFGPDAVAFLCGDLDRVDEPQS